MLVKRTRITMMDFEDNYHCDEEEVTQENDKVKNTEGKMRDNIAYDNGSGLKM